MDSDLEKKPPYLRPRDYGSWEAQNYGPNPLTRLHWFGFALVPVLLVLMFVKF